MTLALRPSTLGEILDRTASLYRAHFLAFLGIAAPPAAVVLGCFGGMVLLASASGPKPEQAMATGLGVIGIMLVGLPLYLGASALSAAAMAHAGSAAFHEEAITIRGSYRVAWKHGWSFLGLYVLEALLIAAPPFVVGILASVAMGVIAVAAGGAGSAAGAVLVLVMMGAAAIYMVWMLLQIVLAFPAAVVEEAGPATALKRAWGLCAGTRLRILVLYLLGIVISWIVSFILMLPLFMVAAIPGMSSPAKSRLLGTIVIIGMYGISFVVQALTKPIYGIAAVLFYYDQRVRKEGFDVELLMRQAGMMEGQAMAQATPWMPVAARVAETWPEPGRAALPAETLAEAAPVAAVLATGPAEPAPGPELPASEAHPDTAGGVA